jgi:hypothetical protein
MSWLISWQGFAAINLTSMAVSLAFGVYAYTLVVYTIDFAPGHVDCVSNIKTMLIVWMATSSFGVVVCSLTVLGRYWPQFKFFPTDDSFRLTVVLKLALLVLKAGVQSMTGHGISADRNGQLLSLLSYISFILSLTLAAMVTIAYQIFKAWRCVDILCRIHHPKTFILCYVVNYVSAKAIAIHILLIALHVGDNMCSEESQNLAISMLRVYGPSLLLLMYNNNECAKFIDGSVQRHSEANDRLMQPLSDCPATIGLSDSPDGVKAITALSVIGQLVGFGMSVLPVAMGSSDRGIAIAATGIASLSGMVMARAV